MEALRARFSTKVESVLEDANALDAFKDWITQDPNRSIDGVHLYFAVKGLNQCIAKRDQNAAKIACQIHRKFVSVRTGTCVFLPEWSRREMSHRIHSLSTSPKILSENLFTPVTESLYRHLAAYHAHFVCSQMFYKFLCSMCSPSPASPQDPTFSPFGELPEIRQPEDESPPPVPAHAENRSRFQHCFDTPTTSSAHARKNTASTEYKPQRGKKLMLDASAIHHEREEDREEFVAVVSERLMEIVRDIERVQKQTGKECYARDLSKHSSEPEAEPLPQRQFPEETSSDEEIARYVGEKIDNAGRIESASPSPPSFPLPLSETPRSSKGPYGVDGFAPPPKTLPRYNFENVPIPRHLMTTSTPGPSRQVDYFLSDSSGFCSAESAFCDRSFEAQQNNVPLHFPIDRSYQMKGFTPMTSSTLMRRPQQSTNNSANNTAYNFSTIPRPHRLPSRQEPTDSITVSLREEGNAPLVAKVPQGKLCLKQFRRLFGISSRDQKRFFFKSTCEDGSAPFQWSVINDDTATVPVFEGKITAECKQCYVDSD